MSENKKTKKAAPKGHKPHAAHKAETKPANPDETVNLAKPPVDESLPVPPPPPETVTQEQVAASDHPKAPEGPIDNGDADAKAS